MTVMILLTSLHSEEKPLKYHNWDHIWGFLASKILMTHVLNKMSPQGVTLILTGLQTAD